MEWTIQDFYAKGGTTTFVDRLAASLGIHASTIKIVGVYEGSLVVDYFIYEPANTNVPGFIEYLENRQIQMLASGEVDLGAPILDLQQNQEIIVNDGIFQAAGFENIIITPTTTNTDGTSTRAEEVSLDPKEEKPRYIHVDTTQVMKLEPEDRIEFQPDISIVSEEQRQRDAAAL